jgi:sarcosine oxidase subunit beta
MTDTFDIIIIGAGVYGCATGWELAKRGASVLILERGTVACGASGGLGKRGVRANGRDPRELALMRDAYELWPQLNDMLGADTGYERTGHIEIYERERDLPIATARTSAQSSLGITTHELDPDTAREIEPALGAAVLKAVHAPLDGVADHTATTRAFASAAAGAGVTIREGASVSTVTHKANRATGVVLASGERINARRGVAVLANAGTTKLLADTFNFSLPIWSVLPQVMRTDALPEPLINGLVGHAHRVLSVKALPGNAVMVSGGWRGTWNDATGKGETVPDQVEGNWAQACAVFPALREHAIAQVSAERLESTTIDGIPIIDHVPGIEGLWFASGWCGHGWAIAPAVAPLLATWALDGQRPELLAPFSHRRFVG